MMTEAGKWLLAAMHTERSRLTIKDILPSPEAAILAIEAEAVAAERARIAAAVERELELISVTPVPWEAGAATAYHWVLSILSDHDAAMPKP